MKIGLIYYAPCDLVAISQNPIDTTSAAVCFIAIQLAKLGHAVTIFSQSPSQDIFNIRCRQIEIKDRSLRLDPALLEKDFDALIFKNCTAEFIVGIKNNLPYKTKIFLWTDLFANDPLNAGLNNHELTQQINSIVCVSNWQRINFYDAFDISKSKLSVINYAIAPLYENLFVDGREFINTKSPTPHIAYLSDVDDGLDLMLDSLYDITDNFKDVKLGIFSPVTDPNLKARLSKNRNVQLYDIKDVPQLISALRDYTIFANPSIKPVTYAVNILETMAAGLYTVTSDVAANNDYCFDHGTVVSMANLRASSLDNFLSAILSVCQSQVHYANKFFDVCFKQAAEMNKKHTWEARASNWLDLIGEH